jgi:LmbE family N-acetylglucosaminyl deacetylase
MQKLVIGIFAHPDDEAFGPSASLIKAVSEGAELQLICVTAGQMGIGHETHKRLGAQRLAEWRAAGARMGASQMYDLGYTDGQLSNHLYQAVATDVETGIRMACKGREHTELCLMTFDTNGVSGHLDHIAVSYIATYVFKQLKARKPKGVDHLELAYYCLSETQVPPDAENYFVYFPEGRQAPYLNRRIDVRAFLPEKYAVMRLHHTQAADAERLIACGDDYHATDYFHVIK